LIKHELIDHRFTMGPPDKLKDHCPHATELGMIVIPSFFGAELYLWAHGLSDVPIDQFLDDSLEFHGPFRMQIDDGVHPMM
jgi:hypothetical protein